MAFLVVLMLILVMAGHSSGTWCICKEGIGEAALQKTLDYACGAGADCNPTHQNGPCFNPNNVRAHCNYAVNSFFQRKSQAPGSCDFAGTASVVNSDPSTQAGCVFPSTASSVSNTPTTTTTTTTPTSTNTTPGVASPYVTTPSNGVLGGAGTGLGPSGAGINTDMSRGGFRLEKTGLFTFLISFVVSGNMVLWG